MKIAIDAKNDGSLLTLNAFEEMIEFDQKIYELKFQSHNAEIDYLNTCDKFKSDVLRNDVCIVDPKPIDFVYDLQS